MIFLILCLIPSGIQSDFAISVVLFYFFLLFHSTKVQKSIALAFEIQPKSPDLKTDLILIREFPC